MSICQNNSRFSPRACEIPNHGFLARFIVPDMFPPLEQALYLIRRQLITPIAFMPLLDSGTNNYYYKIHSWVRLLMPPHPFPHAQLWKVASRKKDPWSVPTRFLHVLWSNGGGIFNNRVSLSLSHSSTGHVTPLGVCRAPGQLSNQWFSTGEEIYYGENWVLLG